MDKFQKLVEFILLAQSDSNISFEDLRGLLVWLGFEERIRGSHHIYRKPGIEERMNLQREGSKAKRYQVKQVRNMLVKNKLVNMQ